MASIFSLLFTLAFLFPIPFSSAISPDSIHNAAEVLSNSGFNSISLTLPLISPTLRLPDLPSATLFTPSDSSFSASSSAAGQPSLSTLQFHFCPRFYSYADLQSLSSDSHLPTLLPNNSLSITSSLFDDDVTINGVKVNPSPLFDDGFFIVYGIDRFLNPNLTSASAVVPTTTPNDCAAVSSGKYNEASAALRSRGYSLMAAFLDLQIVSSNDVVLTVFAPSDVAMEGQIRSNDYSQWGSVFLRHVVGCELSWGDLIGQLDDEAGFVLPTFLDGFKIKVTRSNGNEDGDGNNKSAYSLMLNGEVSVDSPEFYKSNGIVVHGLSGVLVAPRSVPATPSSSSSGYRDGGENSYSPTAGNGADRIEF